MRFKGYKRVKKVYPVWFFIYATILLVMLILELKIPEFFFWLLLVLLLKVILVNYGFIKVKIGTHYWAEHAPLSILVFMIGMFDLLGINSLDGYFTGTTTVIAGLDFLFNFSNDMVKEQKNPKEI